MSRKKRADGDGDVPGAAMAEAQAARAKKHPVAAICDERRRCGDEQRRAAGGYLLDPWAGGRIFRRWASKGVRAVFG